MFGPGRRMARRTSRRTARRTTRRQMAMQDMYGEPEYYDDEPQYAPQAAPAAVLRLARIGEVRGITTFRVGLEVRPPNAAAFESEISLPVRRASLDFC